MKSEIESGCCGPVEDRLRLIEQVSRGLHDGHMGIAALYEEISKDADDEDKGAFVRAAIEHRIMGAASLNIILPGKENEVSDSATTEVRSLPPSGGATG